MKWNNHSNLEGCHAFLSASKFHWINYDDEKIVTSYKKMIAVQMGTRLHAYAAESIALGQKLHGNNTTLSKYVNDAIKFHMKPETVLYYSENCFGTADAISFRNNELRIHDLKTGEIPAHMEQLEIYAALFCLEYDIKPGEISFVLRLYQSNEIIEHRPTAEDILPIMDRIISADKLIKKAKEEI